MVFGTAVAPPRGEWLRTGIIMHEEEKEVPYLLKGPKNTTRGLLTVLQAEILKYLLFEVHKNNKTEPADRFLSIYLL